MVKRKVDHISVKRVAVRHKYYVQGAYDNRVKFRVKWNRKNSIKNVNKKVLNKEEGFILKRDYNKKGIKTISRLKNVEYSRTERKPYNIKRVMKYGDMFYEATLGDRTDNGYVKVNSPSVVIKDGVMYRNGRPVSNDWLDDKMRWMAIKKLQVEVYSDWNLTYADIDVSKHPRNVFWQTIRDI